MLVVTARDERIYSQVDFCEENGYISNIILGLEVVVGVIAALVVCIRKYQARNKPADNLQLQNLRPRDISEPATSAELLNYRNTIYHFDADEI